MEDWAPKKEKIDVANHRLTTVLAVNLQCKTCFKVPNAFLKERGHYLNQVWSVS